MLVVSPVLVVSGMNKQLEFKDPEDVGRSISSDTFLFYLDYVTENSFRLTGGVVC